MAWWNPFSWFDEEEKKRVDITPIKQAPLPPKLTDTSMGKSVNQAIMNAIEQGYGPNYASRVSSPLVAQREARWKEQDLPFLSSEMSARGLGRSTIAGGEIARAGQATARDIDEIIANAINQNQLAKERARGQGLQFAGMEAEIGGQRAGELTRRAGLEVDAAQAAEAAERQRELETQQNINNLIATGLAIGTAPFTGGASLASLPSIYSSSPTGANDYGLIREALKANQASPFMSKKPFQKAFDYYKYA